MATAIGGLAAEEAFGARKDFIRQDKIALMPELNRDGKSRFSDRVDDYRKYRPHYQKDVIQALHQACGLRPDHVVADIGCGTGLSSEIFLQNGNPVIGVEPNRKMREAGEQFLAGYENFRMVEGSAEHTSLPSASVDIAFAGQAFHWFKVDATKAEFARILKPGGWVVLMWHDRDLESTPFLRAYEAFLRRHGIDYEQVAHRWVASYEVLHSFFAPAEMKQIRLRNQQKLDFEGLRGRLMSSSYMPRSGERAEVMLKDLPNLFEAHAEDGHVLMQYDTNIYYGHFPA